MPMNTGLSTSFEPKFRSKKRINRLIGNQPRIPMTRSRINSKDFTTNEEWSCVTTLQELKKKKQSKLNHLKNQDMLLMSN
mmetsp:Transcript_22006/g.24446  ORF Transcript_22006/g.24446 Transcript_22006/m.24446 type:complete len:80 (-) Transcript_22006:125-364(-)